MKQIVQPTGGGPIEVVTAPRPVNGPTEVLVRTHRSLISAGTEKAVTQLAQSSLVDKARARPDLVRQVLTKARNEGVAATVATVRSRLADDLPLGYSAVGTAEAVGTHVRGLRVGQRVATAGAGYANHASYQRVPGLLCAAVPDTVNDDQACYATVASVGLHGLRLADIGPGANVVVVGLGLIGQLTARLALASGCNVFGIDVRQSAVDLAVAHGCEAAIEAGSTTTQQILEWSKGRGADAILITAGGRGDSTIVKRAPERARDRAVVVAVGDVGLDIDRNDFFRKELRLEVPRSYGPGRYDRTYEEWGVDYPIGHVRWTEGRNLEAVLDLIAHGRLAVDDLTTHRVAIDDGASAYDLLEDPSSGAGGILLTYPTEARSHSTVRTSTAPKPGGVGILGAGLFVRSMILPSLEKAGIGPVVHVASASGTTAARLAERHDIPAASADPMEVINDPSVQTVVIATPHSSHAELAIAALDAGKDVYVEKPLAITDDELDAVTTALERTDGSLYVGFNRRHSPMVRAAIDTLGPNPGPIAIDYRVNAGPLPAGHWYADRAEGGRLLGEVCHFIDTCAAIVGDIDVVAVHRVSPNRDDHDTHHLLISYADGSSATILYAADGHAGTPKERCEILGGGHTILIDDYRRLEIDGQRIKVDTGKGHAEGLAAWNAGELQPIPALTTTRTALRSLEAAP